jgi:hypothetical protein
MAFININGLELLFKTDGEFITATNDQLEVKYMAKNTPKIMLQKYEIKSAVFPNNSYKYLALEILQDGKTIELDLLSDIMYELRFRPITTSSSDINYHVDLAELRSKLLRMRIEQYYYQLSVERRFAALTH